MRKKLLTLLLAVAASVGTMFASVTIDGIAYNLNETELTAEATSSDSYFGHIVIPSSVTYNSVAYSVTSIGDLAFSRCIGLISVTIPGSVTSIGSEAFSRCIGLAFVTIPKSVTSIGNSAFSGCTGLASVTIRGSVTSIGSDAFSYCSGLKKVYITDIAAWCNITFGNYPSNPLSSAKHLYVNDVEVTDLVIPNSVTSIGDYAFYGCSGLTSVTIPNSVTSIGGSAFRGCTGLTSVHISDIAAWCAIYFNDNPLEYAHNLYLNDELITDLVIPIGVTSISARAFYGCSGLTSVTIPNSVTSIGNSAFSGCSGLTSVTIPNSVTSIGAEAFRNCTGLTSVTIPNSVTSIGNSAFSGCSGLTSVTIPNSVTSIGNSAFSGCTGLASVTIPNSVTSIGAEAFRNCTGLTSVTIPNSVTSIGDGAFYGCSGLTSVTIPNSVTSIGNSAFYGCSGLTSVTIPNSVTSIGEYAFKGCSSLTSVTLNSNAVVSKDYSSSSFQYIFGGQVTEYIIGNDVTSIGTAAFKGCSGLTSVTIPNSVTSIGEYAFGECSGLTSVTIPNSVTSIGERAFYGVNNVVYTGSATGSPWGAKSVNGYVDGYLVYSDATKTSLLGCSSAVIGEIEIPNSVTDINDNAFRDCRGLTSVMIPNSVINIGEYVFYNCSGLTSGTIPNSVTNIGGSVFQNCSNLVSVTLPNNITSIEQYAFEDCRSLVSVTIPNSVTSIGKQAFDYCESLEYITIPNSVAIIGDYAFRNCSSLTSIEIPNSVTSIGNGAFRYCSGLTSVTIEAETPPALGGSAFDNNSPIYVPCGTLDAYKSAWSNYASQIKYASLPYTISTYAENGNVVTTDVNNLTICDPIIMTVTPNTNYHFTQWSDGNTDNPRTIVLTQDTILTAIIVMDTTGTCGKDYALTWTYSPTSKTLTVSGNGSFDENMECGLVAKQEMTKLVINEGVTAIGNEAFSNCANLTTMQLPTTLKTIGERTFYNCLDLVAIYNYRVNPCLIETNTFEKVNTFDCVLYVLASSIAKYSSDASGWKIFFDIQPIDATTVDNQVTDVTVIPSDNNAVVTWPVTATAETYTLQITKDGVVFCTLIFNGNGQLTGIAFAPGKNGNRHAPAAKMTANGLQFTVTGLNSGTQYGYNLTAKDANDQTVATYSGEFTTTSEGIATGVEVVSSSLQGVERGRLILRNNQIFILRGDKVYTLQGQEVR